MFRFDPLAAASEDMTLPETKIVAFTRWQRKQGRPVGMGPTGHRSWTAEPGCPTEGEPSRLPHWRRWDRRRAGPRAAPRMS